MKKVANLERERVAALLEETGKVTGGGATGIARWIMPFATVVILVEVALALSISHSWPLVHDAPLIHYVVFLMAHGMAPYRDIVEINTPGGYVFEWLGMHLLGGDSVGWWLWDSLAGVVGVFASVWIAGKGHRLAGIVGGTLAYLIHLRDGPRDMGQRDMLIASLLLVAFGFLFEAKRRRQPVWMAGFMGFCGLAASIKPPVIVFGLLLLAVICWLDWRDTSVTGARRSIAITGWSFLGGLVPAAMVVIFLAHWGVARDFLATLQGLDRWYAGLARISPLTLILDARLLLLLVVSAAVPFVMNQSWKRWESDFLAIATLLGAGLFVMQGKGWSYQLSEVIAFSALWAMLELDLALDSEPSRSVLARRSAAVAVPLLTLVLPVLLLRAERNQPSLVATIAHLEGDLNNLGGTSLSGKVQCLDMTEGNCINVLYRMKLVQATGFIYDFYLFPTTTNPVTEPLQQRFMEEMRTRQPELIVVSSHVWPGPTQGYEQIANLPGFVELLQQSYRMQTEFAAPARHEAGYRIYVLKNMPSYKSLPHDGPDAEAKGI